MSLSPSFVSPDVPQGAPPLSPRSIARAQVLCEELRSMGLLPPALQVESAALATKLHFPDDSGIRFGDIEPGVGDDDVIACVSDSAPLKKGLGVPLVVGPRSLGAVALGVAPSAVSSGGGAPFVLSPSVFRKPAFKQAPARVQVGEASPVQGPWSAGFSSLASSPPSLPSLDPKLVPLPKPYSGDHAAPRLLADWRDDVGFLLSIQHVNAADPAHPHLTVNVCYAYTAGNARAHLRDSMELLFTLDDVVALLCEAYVDPDAEEAAQSALAGLRQASTAAADFVSKYRDAVRSCAVPPPVPVLLAMFKRALNPGCLYFYTRLAPTTLDQAYRALNASAKDLTQLQAAIKSLQPVPGPPHPAAGAGGGRGGIGRGKLRARLAALSTRGKGRGGAASGRQSVTSQAAASGTLPALQPGSQPVGSESTTLALRSSGASVVAAVPTDPALFASLPPVPRWSDLPQTRRDELKAAGACFRCHNTVGPLPHFAVACPRFPQDRPRFAALLSEEEIAAMSDAEFAVLLDESSDSASWTTVPASKKE